jgi:hypothetical protein
MYGELGNERAEAQTGPAMQPISVDGAFKKPWPPDFLDVSDLRRSDAQGKCG